MRLDMWYFQPWAWLWSDLERDRLGRWLIPVMLVTMMGPGWLLDGVTGFLGAAILAGVVVTWGHHATIRRAQRQGWDTLFVEPTSWAVRRATERAVWGDPNHWANAPHFERHTQETQWISPEAFAARRRAEWQALYAGSVVDPARVLISHTFSTIGTSPAGYAVFGTPFPALARREARALPRIQRHMFGRVVSRRGPGLADPAHWHVVAVPVDLRAATPPPAQGLPDLCTGKDVPP